MCLCVEGLWKATGRLGVTPFHKKRGGGGGALLICGRLRESRARLREIRDTLARLHEIRDTLPHVIFDLYDL